jgi:hypothetical protein
VSDQQRDRCIMQELVGRAAQEPLPKAGVAITSHHDEVCIEPSSLRDQRRSDTAVADSGAVQGDIDAVMLEMIDRVGTQRRLQLGRGFVVDDEDRHLIRLVQIRERLCQRAGGFPASVPGDEDAIESRLGRLAIGHQEHMPA